MKMQMRSRRVTINSWWGDIRLVKLDNYNAAPKSWGNQDPCTILRHPDNQKPFLNEGELSQTCCKIFTLCKTVYQQREGGNQGTGSLRTHH